MSNEIAYLMLRYDGILSVNEEFLPKYSGGKSRPIQLHRNTTFEALKIVIKNSLGINEDSVDINLICRFPVDDAFIATSIEDNDVTQVVLSMACHKTLVVYVEIVPAGQSLDFRILETGDLELSTSRPSTSRSQNARPSTSRPSTSRPSTSRPSTSRPSTSRPSTSRPSTSKLPSSKPSISRPSAARPSVCRLSEVDSEGYETMCSDDESSNEDDDHSNDDSEQNILFGHEHLKQILSQSYESIDRMMSINDYVEYCKSTKEWDADPHFDDCIEGEFSFPETYIPEELTENMCFSSKAELQFAVMGWSIMNNVQYKMVQSNKSRYVVVCSQHDDSSRPCNWRMGASSRKRLGGAWRISSISGLHTCSNPILLSDHRQCTSKFICYYILPFVRQYFDIKPREIIARIEAKFNIKISYIKAWDARRKAIKTIFGTWEESYRSLFRFMEAITAVMVGSVYRIQLQNLNTFGRLFWSFGASISGWIHCRPVLTMDGTFLLGKYRGTLLTAIAVDANNGLFPLAFAIVESESVESWIWFLQCLYSMIPSVRERSDLCIISDRHAGLVRGCREIFPSAAHRHCLRHLRENFKKTLRGLGIADVEFMCQKMYWAGNTDEKRRYAQLMRDIESVSSDAYDWLVQRDPEKWSLSNDGGYRYGLMTTNAAECFNSVLKRARGLPIQALICSIYYNLVSIFLKRADQAEELLAAGESQFVPKCAQKILQIENDARKLPTPIMINRREYEVYDSNNRAYKVLLTNTGQVSCTCGRTIIYHIPCHHVIAVCSLRHMSHLSFISHYYTVEQYKMTYSGDFHVIPEKENWPNFNSGEGLVELTVPTVRKHSGRPRVSRIRNTMDGR